MTYSVSRRRREGELIRGQWEPLIDTSTWEAVQHQLRLKAGRRGLPSNSNPGREYAFRGLLTCGLCGKRMWLEGDRGRVYYRCRGFDAPERCMAGWVREEKLLKWGDELFARLDTYRRSDFVQRVAAASGSKRKNLGALAQVEAVIERNRKLFAWGHIPESAYQQENARLEAVRQELLVEVAPAAAPIELDGLLDAWRTGLPTIRHELLGRLFDGLEVKDGWVVRYIPARPRGRGH